MAVEQEIPFASPPEVRAAFERCPEPARSRLLELRRLVFATGEATPAVGPIRETLKWGQPSFLPERPRTGTAVRIDRHGSDARCAVYFHCQTTLVRDFRGLYGELFEFEGNRALILDAEGPFPREALGHCIALALTYHKRRRSKGQNSASRERTISETTSL